MVIEIFPSRAVVRPERNAALVRLRRGLYADSNAVEAMPRHDEHLLRVRAVAAARSGAIFARESALALAGLPFGAPDDVFTIGDPSMPGNSHGVRNSHVAVADSDLELEDGIARCTVPFALADLARRGKQVDAVAALDAALRSERTSIDEVADALSRQGPSGQRRAEWVLGFADARSESVGESWSRVAIHRLGCTVPELQYEVMTRIGAKSVDFRFERPGRRPLACEFDGFVKYSSIPRAAGQTPEQALFQEKLREDAIRETHDVARWVWHDARNPMRLQRILAAAHIPTSAHLLPGW